MFTGADVYDWFESIQQNNFKQIKRWIDKGFDVNTTDKSGVTALVYSTARKDIDIDIVRTLIKHGARTNYRDFHSLETPLINTVQHDNIDVAKLILNTDSNNVDAQNSFKETALFVAAMRNNLDMVKLLLKYGANPNIANDSKKTALMQCVFSGNLKIADVLINNGAKLDVQDKSGKTVFMYALRRGNLDILNFFIKHVDHGADCLNFQQDSEDSTVLMMASKSGNLNAVNVLLDAGADVNVRNRNKTNALSLAVGNEHVNVMKALIKHGADLDVKGSHGDVVFFDAVRLGNTDMVSVFIDNGVDVYARDNENRNALTLAVQEELENMVEFLLTYKDSNNAKLNFDVNEKDKNGKTLLMVASDLGNVNILNLLMKFGADVNARDDQGKTVLMQSMNGGYSCIATAIIEYGKRGHSVVFK